MKVAMGFVVSACVILAASAASAQTAYTWNGGTSSNWQTVANWSTTGFPGMAPYGGGESGTIRNARIRVDNGLTTTGNTLVYSANEGYTIYSGVTAPISVCAGYNGSMSITGGTWESRPYSTTVNAYDVIGSNSHTGSLSISGGTYLNIAGRTSYSGAADANGITLLGNNGGLGTLNVDGGSFTASTMQFGSGNTGSGTLNLNTGGTLSVGQFYDIGNATSAINFNGGTLKPLVDSTRKYFNGTAVQTFASTSFDAFMTGIDSVKILSGGALIDTDGQNVTIGNAISNGASIGALTKQGSGTLTLSNSANTYTGDTIVEAGTLSISHAFLADSSTVSIASGAQIALTFSDSDTIGALYLNGALADAGYWGATGNAAATHTSDLITGTGLLYIVPEPSSLILAAAGMLGLIAYAWRKRTI